LLKEQKTDEHKARVRDIFLYISNSCVTAFSTDRQLTAFFFVRPFLSLSSCSRILSNFFVNYFSGLSLIDHNHYLYSAARDCCAADR